MRIAERRVLEAHRQQSQCDVRSAYLFDDGETTAHESPRRERAAFRVRERVEHDPVADAQTKKAEVFDRNFSAVGVCEAETCALDARIRLLVMLAAQDRRAARLGALARREREVQQTFLMRGV